MERFNKMKTNQEVVIDNLCKEFGENNNKVSERIRYAFNELVSLKDRLFSDRRLSEEVDIDDDYKTYINSSYHYED
tara:strand:- start:622 stop:849 length:228 start_codon:yes stop_codon:yes gene_type:complete